MKRVAPHRGFSLVELLVGMVVSLICTLAMLSAFAVYEGKKRTTTSGNDAQQNGSYAIYELERQLRTAGSSVVQGYNYGAWGCPVTAATTSTQRLPATSLPAPFTSSGWPLTTRLVPALIASGGSNKSDVIGVVSGNAALQIFKIAVTGTPGVNNIVVGNSLGIQTGDYLLGTLSDGSCALAHIPSVSPTAQVASNTIVFDMANSPSTGLVSATYAFDMGPAPTFTLFGVDPTSNSLVSYDLLQRPINSNAPGIVQIADGIVQIKALYGIHTNAGDSSPDQIDQWVKPTGSWSIKTLTASASAASTATSEIKAIRIAVVAQSRLPERSSDYVGGKSLTLFADLATSLQYKVPTQTQYRYKVYDTTVPIRNALVITHY